MILKIVKIKIGVKDICICAMYMRTLRSTIYSVCTYMYLHLQMSKPSRTTDLYVRCLVLMFKREQK
jgi:hypothetical protein